MASFLAEGLGEFEIVGFRTTNSRVPQHNHDMLFVLNLQPKPVDCIKVKVYLSFVTVHFKSIFFPYVLTSLHLKQSMQYYSM